MTSHSTITGGASPPEMLGALPNNFWLPLTIPGSFLVICERAAAVSGNCLPTIATVCLGWFFCYFCLNLYLSEKGCWELSTDQIWVPNSQYWPSYASLKFHRVQNTKISEIWRGVWTYTVWFIQPHTIVPRVLKSIPRNSILPWRSHGFFWRKNIKC